MLKCFTTIDLVEGSFVGTIYNSNTNTVIYKTIPYENQSQALQDINIYLKTLKSPDSAPVPISNTFTQVTQEVRKCCGR